MKSDEELLLEDIQEQADIVGSLTPRDYAKLRNITPQLVYYYIRTGKIKEHRCECGRKIVRVTEADQYLQEKADAQRRRSGQPILRPDTEGHPDEGSGSAVQELP